MIRDGEFWFDEAAAERAISFYPLFLRHLKGEWAGRPFELDEWQKRDIIGPLFGWKNRDGTRRYTRCDAWLPRKNGKSTLAAGVALYLMWADGEPAAEVYGAANDKEQAKIVFKDAAAMVKGSPDLVGDIQIFKQSMVCPTSLSSYTVLSSESENKDGLNIHGLVWDEFHEVKDQDLYDKLTTASGSRRQPLMFLISTAGFDQTSLGYKEYLLDRKILDGKVRRDNRLVVIYEAGKDDNWRDPKTWAKANPGWGGSVKPAYIRAQFEEAKIDAAKEQAFRRYHCNQWTSSLTGWMDMDAWDRCAEQINLQGLLNEKCWIGLDLSKRNDITAAAALFRRGVKGSGSEVYTVLVQCFMPEEGIEDREARDGIPYRDWSRQGFITLTPGNVIDYQFIRTRVQQWGRLYKVQEIAYDPYSATQLALQLQDEDGFTCVEFAQSMKLLSPPTKELHALVLQRRFEHGGNPVLRWMAENAVVITDSNENQKVTKKNSKKRVDGVVATINALGRSMADVQRESDYENRGLAGV